jgi:TRAP transporter TAXI family solute receptor
MALEDLSLLSRQDRIRLGLLLLILAVVIVWATIVFVDPGPPRRIVMASGAEFGLYHRYAQRYKELLAREGVQVEERMTGGADENLRLLLDPKAHVDVAFVQGGLARPPVADGLVMLASLYYEPVWVFYRDTDDRGRLTQLIGKKIAVGAPGSGTRALAEPLITANGLLRGGTELLPLGGTRALAALRAHEVDAAIFVGGAETPLIQEALRDHGMRLMSFERAESYARRYPFITKLTLPSGTLDLAASIPEQDVTLIATKAMLVSRDDLHPALVNLLLDAARDIHGQQGYFETAGEFPSTMPVDLPVSGYADQHKRFGRSLLYRYLPFWLAALVERLIIVVVPLLVILVPVINFLPQFLRWRVRSRIFRWYGELALLERTVATTPGPAPIEQWLKDLDRIERGVAGIRTPPKFANEAYTLREHIDLVRREVNARAGAVGASASGS